MNKISIIDTHAHYNKYVLVNINKAIELVNKNDDISKVINVGLNNKSSEEVVDISSKNDKFYASIGIHPLYDGDVSELEKLYYGDSDKIVAIGETGIDTSDNLTNQIMKFRESIELANKLELPLIIHANTTKNSTINATKLCLDILDNYNTMGYVFHSFQPDVELAKRITYNGGYVSFGPMILKSNAKKSLEVIENVPIEKILVETDYPFMTDDSNKVVDVFKKICELRCQSEYSLTEQLNANAKRLFYKL
ncbi:MAG: TatD family hydrolase [Bacilli bacterium]|nr:TatD family hydrolase [Bacilli bacterium]